MIETIALVVLLVIFILIGGAALAFTFLMPPYAVKEGRFALAGGFYVGGVLMTIGSSYIAFYIGALIFL